MQALHVNQCITIHLELLVSPERLIDACKVTRCNLIHKRLAIVVMITLSVSVYALVRL